MYFRYNLTINSYNLNMHKEGVISNRMVPKGGDKGVKNYFCFCRMKLKSVNVKDIYVQANVTLVIAEYVLMNPS